MLSLLQPNHNLPTGKIFAFLLIGLFNIGIAIVTIQNSRDAIDRVSDEEKLQVLDSKYRDGKALTENEFKTYCELLEKIWKKHLPACYCKDGIENPTPGIDWTNPPKSPEDLGSAWIDATDPRMKENSSRRRFQNLITKEVVAFDIGVPDKTGYKEENHWHRENPNTKNKNDAYLDECGKPVARGNDESHIKIKELTKWE
ncbi:MAG: hypothetical protein IPL26_21130 [Leptospiraceae bacterium]|nr:hypothetical protein [Leptospiraceae bacterium]